MLTPLNDSPAKSFSELDNLRLGAGVIYHYDRSILDSKNKKGPDIADYYGIISAIHPDDTYTIVFWDTYGASHNNREATLGNNHGQFTLQENKR